MTKRRLAALQKKALSGRGELFHTIPYQKAIKGYDLSNTARKALGL